LLNIANNREFGRLKEGIGHPGHASPKSPLRPLKKAAPDEFRKTETNIDEIIALLLNE